MWKTDYTMGTEPEREYLTQEAERATDTGVGTLMDDVKANGG